MRKISAVVVLFNPDVARVLVLVKSLLSQVEFVVLVDNGSDNSLEMKNAAKRLPGVCVLSLGGNFGIARAQNLGVQYSFGKGADAFIFFDQDSTVGDGFVSALVGSYNDLNKLWGGKVAVVGPVFSDPRFGFCYPVVKLSKYGFRTRVRPEVGAENIDVSYTISSGSLCSAETFFKVGGFNEEYFIDYVDTEWCLRAVSMGYKIFVSAAAVMDHTIGDDNYKFLLWRLPVHSPIRKYYRMRNMFYLMRLGYVPIIFKLREFFINNAHHFIILFRSKNKRDYWNSWVSAVRDGLCGTLRKSRS